MCISRGDGSRPRVGGRRGITLIELLLALSILGVISGVVAATFATAVTAWRAGTAAADASHHADAVVEQLYMALRSSYYPETREPLDRYGFLHTRAGGSMPSSHDTISWVKLGPALIGEDTPYAGVPHRVEVTRMDSAAPQGAGLYVRSWRLDGQPEDFDPERDTDPLLLSPAVVGFQVLMSDPDYRPMTHSDPIDWIDHWDATNRIPAAVQFSLAIGSTNPRAKPLVLERMVNIPMAELSWNPTVTGGAQTRRARRPARGRPPAGGTP